jgi:hypothetical protein
MRQIYHYWQKIWQEILLLSGSNITYFTFYIHLWPIYWLSFYKYHIFLSSSCLLTRELAPILEQRAHCSLSSSFTGGRTPWTGDQLVARPLPKHRTTQT